MKTIRDIQNEDALLEAIIESDRIGALMRNGRIVYYANLRPLGRGNTVEGATKLDVARKLLDIENR